MRIGPTRVAFLLLVAGVATAGFTPPQRGSQESRTAALEAKVAELEAAQQATLTRLNQIRLDLDNTLEPLRVRLADYGEDMRRMESRMVALEEQLALTNEGISRLADQLSRGGGTAAATQPVGTPMPPPQRPAGVRGPTVARSGEEQPPPPAVSEADALYSSAYTDYLRGNYPLAISGFQEFLEIFPDSEKADNAQYWIGESRYSEEDYQAARFAFLEIPRRYPNGDTVSDALFKAAQCLVELGATDRAIEEFYELIRQHPTSGTVPIACLQLERLGAPLPLTCQAP